MPQWLYCQWCYEYLSNPCGGLSCMLNKKPLKRTTRLQKLCWYRFKNCTLLRHSTNRKQFPKNLLKKYRQLTNSLALFTPKHLTEYIKRTFWLGLSYCNIFYFVSHWYWNLLSCIWSLSLSLKVIVSSENSYVCNSSSSYVVYSTVFFETYPALIYY